ncbi:WD40-repeat-containing domain protein [Schizophyllum fasciatum]
MPLTHALDADIYVLACSQATDAADLVALGDHHSVHVVQITDAAIVPLAVFHLGARVTALGWSAGAVSPSVSDDWHIDLVAGSADFGLFHLSKLAGRDECIYNFGAGSTGHNGGVNSIAFVGGYPADSTRYVATCGGDKTVLVWDLYPERVNDDARASAPPPPDASVAPEDRTPPTAYEIPYAHPLTTVCAHPHTSKELLVADTHGTIFLVDWRSDDPSTPQPDRRTVLELVQPYAMGDALIGNGDSTWTSVAWRRDTTDIIGSVTGNKYHIWDLAKLHGGKPLVTGPTFSQGGKFRWCNTHPEFFAISSSSPATGAILHVHNLGYLTQQPTQLAVAAKPHYVRDFDFLATRGVPRIAAAVGRSLVIMPIGATEK